MGAVWLIGENNPYGTDPRFDLYPRPDGSAGARLTRYLGLGERAYLREFKRRNLLRQAKWSVPAARAAADSFAAEVAVDDAAVLLGARVAAAFGFDFRSNLWRVLAIRYRLTAPVGGIVGAVGPKVFAVVPHPSGRSREWNDPGAPARLREVIGQVRGIAGGGITPGG